jgi:predicted metal-dependent TIM-barrel fold hydrolase
MKYIDPHIHCISRTTDDYLYMARAGVVAVSEPAFWAGFDRSSAASFYDYFRHLVDHEPRRAARYGIQHYSWLCINAKEAENVSLSREVIKLIPQFLDRPTVLAARTDQLILIHTPHLEDKHKGTSIIVDILKNDRRIRPQRVLIDHCEEHTIRLARDNGFWAGLTVYPVTKVTPQRAADILEQFGPQMIMVNSAADWGESSPSMLTDTCLEFLSRGHSEREAIEIFFNNPCRFFGQCQKWKIPAIEML